MRLAVNFQQTIESAAEWQVYIWRPLLVQLLNRRPNGILELVVNVQMTGNTVSQSDALKAAVLRGDKHILYSVCYLYCIKSVYCFVRHCRYKVLSCKLTFFFFFFVLYFFKYVVNLKYIRINKIRFCLKLSLIMYNKHTCTLWHIHEEF